MSKYLNLMDYCSNIEKLEEALQSIDIISLSIDIKDNLHEDIENSIDNIASEYIDGEEYEELEDILNDEEKIDAIKDEFYRRDIAMIKQKVADKLQDAILKINKKLNMLDEYMI